MPPTVLVEEYITKNGCRIVEIGIHSRIVIGEDLGTNNDVIVLEGNLSVEAEAQPFHTVIPYHQE